MTTFGSVCSGIEAASVAWAHLGWKADWLSEIEPFPSAVLKARLPGVPNLGDMTEIPSLLMADAIRTPDILCGGTPCQAFSVAGKRKSLDDDRGNLSLIFTEIADELDASRQRRGKEPAVIFWENVPGVLTTKDNAFGCFLGQLVGADAPLSPGADRWPCAGFVTGPKRKVAWRVLDAQYFGVPQRRRRVFVVASARERFNPAAVLFEQAGVRGDSPQSGGPQESIAPASDVCTPSADSKIYDLTHPCDVVRISDTVPTLKARMCTGGNGVPCVISKGYAEGSFGSFVDRGNIAATLKASGGMLSGGSETLVAIVTKPVLMDAFQHHGFREGATCGTLTTENANPVRGDTPLVAIVTKPAYAIAENIIGRQPKNGGNGNGFNEEICYTLNATGVHGVAKGLAVRRLTVRECERLQGFPDDWTRIAWKGKPKEDCPDAPRYKAVGNSWAVPCARWIGERLKKEMSK